jgi:sulfoxide reductase heme-binding subunit YedZ
VKKISLFFSLLIPFGYLLYQFLFTDNIIDPIKYLYTYTGVVAIVILFFTTVISIFKKWYNIMKYRKMIGIFGFFYALIHASIFFIFDGELDLVWIIKETFDKPFIYLGMSAFIILIFMTITSTNRLFKKFNKYHMSLYIVLLFVTIHFIMAQKTLNISQWFYLFLIFIVVILKLLQKFYKKRVN